MPTTHKIMNHGVRSIAAIVIALAGLAGARTTSAEIKLPNLLSDHAVLQRGVPIHVWGWAAPDAKLSIRFHEQMLHATANDLGAWSAWLMPERAGGPYTLTIDGGSVEGEKQITDVMVGDVWIASGQSNMQIPLRGFPPTAFIKNGVQEIASANNPMLRLMLVGQQSSDIPLQDVKGEWTLCTPETASEFSAVAYFFGREIAAKEHVAIGLIDSTWGGTPISSWVSMDSLGNNAALLSAFSNRARFADQQTDLSAQIAAEKAADAAASAAGKPKPVYPWHPDEVSWLPAGLYNGMIAPLTPETIKGFLWYQGETDSSHERAPHYSTLFPALIQDWRTHFQQGNLPFLYVQISSFHSPQEEWGVIRDAQRRTLFVANTAMTVSLDVGNPENVHPADKQTVGHRLALTALGLVYGDHIEYASPQFREATTEPGALRLWFDNASGLNSNGKALEDFELAGSDHRFVPATARIEGNTIIVSTPSLADPLYVRYGWSNVVTSWFYNSAGLPGSTFTSEEVPSTDESVR
ncbi:MAG: sialate O-acetylesterase [Acidobacteriaceae bacterium]